jgi:hypothetical protein
MILGRFDTAQLSANASGAATLASNPVHPPLPSDLALLEDEAGAFPVPSELRRVSLLLLAAVALATLFVGVRHLAKNRHVVAAGALLRSAQPSAGELSSLLERHDARSVLNLRGARPGAAWYDAELALSARAQVEHVDFELSASRDVPPAQAAELVALMARLPKPLLVHCEGGADRSGLAAALYRYSILHDPPQLAAAELSGWFGHVPWLRPGVAAMDRSFAAFVAANAALARAAP